MSMNYETIKAKHLTIDGGKVSIYLDEAEIPTKIRSYRLTTICNDAVIDERYYKSLERAESVFQYRIRIFSED